MKKKLSVNLIGSVFFAIMIYIFALSSETANAGCIDVTKDPCYCELFSVPIGPDTAKTTWFALYHNQPWHWIDYLRTLNIMMDTCNNLDDYKEGAFCSSKYHEKGYTVLDDCLYFRQCDYLTDLPFGFIKDVKVGDTIDISYFDPRNTNFISEINDIETYFCNIKIILEYYDISKSLVGGTILFSNYFQKLEFDNFRFLYNHLDIVLPIVFSPTTNTVANRKNGSLTIHNLTNSDELHVFADFNTLNSDIEIYDLLGICQIRAQIQENETVIDISKLTSGVYIVRAGRRFSKFIRE